MNRAALVIIDPQIDFLGLVAPGTAAPALDAMARLLDGAREADAPVIVTQELHRPERVDFGRELDGDEPVHCVEGTPGAELVAALRPRTGEYLVRKRRYSAFFATDLALLLRGLGVNTVVACGFLTDVCVHYTCVDAHQHDLHVHVIPDACAGSTVEASSAAIAAIAYLQAGAVLGVQEACMRLGDSTAGSSK
jgi:nicotinamidase-related amidase